MNPFVLFLVNHIRTLDEALRYPVQLYFCCEWSKKLVVLPESTANQSCLRPENNSNAFPWATNKAIK